MIGCRDVERFASAYVDGDLDPARASAVRGHLRGCRGCLHRIEDEATLRDQARSLEAALDPPVALWARIERELAGAELADARRSGLWLWWQGARRPATLALCGLLGCAAALAIATRLRAPPSPSQRPAARVGIAQADAAAPAASVPGAPASFEDQVQGQVLAAERRYERSIAELRELARAERAGWAPGFSAAFDARMAELERELSRQRVTAAGDVSPVGRDGLLSAYRRQYAFLSEAAVGGRDLALTGRHALVIGVGCAWLAARAAQAEPAQVSRPASGSTGIVDRAVFYIQPSDPRRGVTAVSIDNRFGDIAVRGHEASHIRLGFVKRAPDAETMDRLRVSYVYDPAGRVQIRATLQAAREARPVPAGSIGVDLAIWLPRGARLEASAWNGTVAIEGLDNGVQVAANDGRIEIRNVTGAVRTQGAIGRQEFERVVGALDAEGLEGELSFEAVAGERLGARIHRGNISARRVRARQVALLATIGNIAFDGEAVPGGTIRIAAHRGDVRVSFRQGTAIRIEAIARQGSVTADGVPLRRDGERMLGAYGGGRQPAGLFVRTEVGDIRVGLAAEARP